MNNLFYHNNNNIPMNANKPIMKYLSYEGGGLRGLAEFGALRYLQEKGYTKDLLAVSGSSFGAIVALATVLNLDTYQVEQKFKTTKVQAVTLWDIVFLIPNLILNYGIKDTSLLKFLATNVLQLANLYLNCIKVKSRGWAWKKADAAYNQLKSAAPY